MFNWDRDAITFYRKHDYLFKSAMIGYAPIIHLTKTIMEERKPYQIELPIKIWNGGFAIFNLMGTYHTLPDAFRFKFDREFANTEGGKWVFYLNVSKTIEMWDVLFPLLKKRHIPFLHVYHHLVTLIFCYLCTYTKSISGYWNATVNYFVHSLMYVYLLMPKSEIKHVFGKLVARAHVVEMIIGLGINIFSLFVKRQNKIISSIGIAMYLSYLYLFAKLLPKRKSEENAENSKSFSESWDYVANAKIWSYISFLRPYNIKLADFEKEFVKRRVEKSQSDVSLNKIKKI